MNILLFLVIATTIISLVTEVASDDTFVEFLYDLNVDPTEAVNLIDSSTYSTALADIKSTAKSWLNQVGDEDNAYDPDSMFAAMNVAGGFAPWIEDTSQHPITQKYSYADAPHIIFLVVDDWGFNEVGYQSTYMNWVTPHMDSLALKGIRLTNYQTHEYCMPARAALLTGKYGFRFGMQTIGHITSADGPKHELPLSAYTIGEEFQSAGYRTAIIGKWHMGYSSLARYPTYRGFDYYYGFMEGTYDYLTKKTDLNVQGVSHWFLDMFENEDLITDPVALSEETYGAIDLQAKAEATIHTHARDHPDKPLYMYYATPLTHSPFDELPEQYMKRCVQNIDQVQGAYQEKCAMLSLLDEMVANLTCVLAEHDMWDNTVFVVTADNGALSQFHGGNFPYRGHKFEVWRGSQSVPAFIYGNSVIPPASRGTMYNGLTHATGSSANLRATRCICIYMYTLYSLNSIFSTFIVVVVVIDDDDDDFTKLRIAYAN